MAWFPTVGLLIGGLLCLADWILQLILPPLVAAAMLLLAWVAISGGLHLDGLMDCCDGLLSARPPERRLEIMKDSRLGAFAVLGAICILLLKLSLVLEVPAPLRLPALWVSPALSRAAMVFAAKACPYARHSAGLGKLFQQDLSWRHVTVAMATAALAAGILLGVNGLLVALSSQLLTVVVAHLVQRRIPGLTGDAYGMINELTEVGALVCLLVVKNAAW